MTVKNTARFNRFKWLLWKPLSFVQLFAFLLLYMVLAPLLSRSPLLSALVGVFFVNVLIVTLSSAGFKLRLRWFLVALLLLVLLLNGAVLWTGNVHAGQILSVASDIIGALLTVICVIVIVRHVLTSHEVTVDTIFAAFVAFFLIGFTFSSIYQALAVFEPASFSIPAASGTEQDVFLKMQLHYFSFVTIATLGYGDIVPRLPLTQTLAILEAVIGQFYMAVVIAWLVSVYSRRGKEWEGRDTSSSS
jgi:voltage-gated potassium channel